MGGNEKAYIDRNLNGNNTNGDSNKLVTGQNDDQSKAAAPKTNGLSPTETHWKVLFYVPNLMGYMRIILSFYGYQAAMNKETNDALNMWIFASILDLLDGMAARKLNQCSKFGVLVDIIADNILRSIIWISIIMQAEEHGRALGVKIYMWTAIIFLEWITFFCSQLKAYKRSHDSHWKKDMVRRADGCDDGIPPFWVQAVFKDNFRTFPGILAIYGLFVAPIGTFVMYADEVWPKLFLSESLIFALILIAYIGRILTVAVELWICFDCAHFIIKHGNNKKSKVA